MVKKLIHVIIVLVLMLIGGASYLLAITVPVNINTMVREELAAATSKKIFIGEIRFDLLKGLVLDDMVVYGQGQIFIWAKSVSCGMSLSSMMRGMVEMPLVTVDSPAIYVERHPDGSFNLSELLPANYKPNPVTASILHRLIVRRARAVFIDRTLEPIFKERVDDIYMDVRLSANGNIALDISGDVPLDLPIRFKFSGVYSISDNELAGRLEVKNLILSEFKDYYKSASCVSFPRGTVDADAGVRLTHEAIDLDLSGIIKNLSIVKDELRLRVDSTLKAMARYEFKDKVFEYAGKSAVSRMDVEGIGALGALENIKADIEFTDTRLWSENITADAYGLRWKARLNIFNFVSPITDIYADADGHLSVIKKMLEDDFKIRLPADIAGKANIKLALQMLPAQALKMNGRIMLAGAMISLGSGNFPIEDIYGEAQFNFDGLKWSDIKLKYRDDIYTSSGSLKDFTAPKIELEASSPALSFKSAFSIEGPIAKVSRLEGKYLYSTFSASGRVGLPAKKPAETDIKGVLNIELTDLKKILKDTGGLSKMGLSGRADILFDINGDTSELKRCGIHAKIKSSDIAIYGFKLKDVAMDYAQTAGVGRIKYLKSLFCGGSLYASGKINWTVRALPYSFDVDVKDVKLDDFKADTAFKDKDVSGTIKAFASLKGTFNKPGRVTGRGRLSITNGKLWQLNLFRGIGSIIFTDDFSDIIFTDGSCDFKLARDGFIVNNFLLKSELLRLYGSGTIGFDKSINAKLKSEIAESAVEPGARGTIAMAVGSSTVIKVTGTLDRPECKTSANLRDVVSGIAEAMF